MAGTGRDFFGSLALIAGFAIAVSLLSRRRIMTRFSANLGFLWDRLPLPDAIRAAKTAGFDAVECHWPYEFPAEDISKALRETRLPMLGINTVRGDLRADETGLSALMGREEEAKATINQAVAYAADINAQNVHVMAGNRCDGADTATFITNLSYACDLAAVHGIGILIEPINHHDIADYFLKTTGQAIDIITRVNKPNLKMIFDCYHVQIMEGDISRKLETLMPYIGHIQIAAVPSRAEPDEGELDYRHVFKQLEELGYDGPLGAEYKPRRTTDAGLDWLKTIGGK